MNLVRTFPKHPLVRGRCWTNIPHQTVCARYLGDQASRPSTSHSWLYVSNKYGDKTFAVVKPAFDVDYYRSVIPRIESILNDMDRHGMDTTQYSVEQLEDLFNRFIVSLQNTQALKKKRDKAKKKLHKSNQKYSEEYGNIQKEYVETRDKFYKLEELIVPFVLNIPNQVRPDAQVTDQLVDTHPGHKASVSSHLDYVKLGYFNNVYQPSIIGPNAEYLIGYGAQLYHSIAEFMSDHLESNDFVAISCLDLVKSAIREAVVMDQVLSDKYMLSVHPDDKDDNQRLHLVGDASLEAFCACITKLKMSVGKFYQVGSCYNNPTVEQTHCVSASILSNPDNSEEHILQLYQAWWQAFQTLNIKCRSLDVGLSGLLPSEHARYDIQAWLPSKQDWVTVTSITDYGHFLSVRLGMDNAQDKHILFSSLNIMKLVQCVLEQYHDPKTGNIATPDALKEFIPNDSINQ